MKFGVNLINFGPGVTPESLARTVALVEALGYHFAMTSDHVAVTPDVSGRYPAPLYAARTEVGMKFDEIREKEGLGAALKWRAAQFAD